MRDKAEKYFTNITERERAIFEAGIKLGAAYHQFIGMPIPNDTEKLKMITAAIEHSIKTQPWVKEAHVEIRNNKKNNRSKYSYGEIKRDNLKIIVVIKYGSVEVKAKIEYSQELDYPLAYIERVQHLTFSPP